MLSTVQPETEKMAESLTHPVLGRLRWEAEFSWWLGEARFLSGVRADLVIAPGDAGAAFIDTAAALYERIVDAEARIRREAAEVGIRELYRRWRNEDEPELVAEELASRLEPTFLRIDTIIPITLSYGFGEQNEVFGGHAVDVLVGEQLHIERVSLA